MWRPVGLRGVRDASRRPAPPVHCPALDAPLEFVVAPLGQRLQERTGSLMLPPVENQPWSHIAQLDPPLPGEQATPAWWEMGEWEGVRTTAGGWAEQPGEGECVGGGCQTVPDSEATHTARRVSR
jgi:hypothetical protein